MQVNTKWFGTVDIDDNKIITFDLGIIGFEYCKQFTLTILLSTVKASLKKMLYNILKRLKKHLKI